VGPPNKLIQQLISFEMRLTTIPSAGISGLSGCEIYTGDGQKANPPRALARHSQAIVGHQPGQGAIGPDSCSAKRGCGYHEDAAIAALRESFTPFVNHLRSAAMRLVWVAAMQPKQRLCRSRARLGNRGGHPPASV